MNQISTTVTVQRSSSPSSPEYDLVLYLDPLPMVCSECAWLIKMAKPQDVVVKPSFPPWLGLEPWALQKATEKDVRIVEESKVFDSSLFIFGKEERVVKSISSFAAAAKGRTIHLVIPVVWKGVSRESLFHLIRGLSFEGIKAKLVE